jgi:nuclear cap-binding protein subunit 1
MLAHLFYRKNQLILDRLVEQPLKIPFVAAVVLYAHDLNAEASKGIIQKVGFHIQAALQGGKWREFKLFLRFFAFLQPILDSDGVFPVLDQLFNWAADLQAASQEDAVGLELVKIILLTIPYALSFSATGLEQKVSELLEQTEIIASARHPLENLVDPFPGESEDKPFGFQSFIELLQNQLRREETGGWELRCIPRIYKPVKADGEDEATEKPKLALPALTIPAPVNFARLPLFPETYFSIYADQETEVRYSMFGAGEGTTNGLQSVPSTADVASSLIRDVLVDTINVLDFNRIATARFLIEMDVFWAPGTFATRGISFDQLKNFPADRSTWKPEDVVLDAIFSQMLLLPTPAHKLVYYHSLITEACKIAPSHVAPTLGRGIRFLYRHLDVMDMELTYRYLDWFAHHLSNFEFRWKWTEW